MKKIFSLKGKIKKLASRNNNDDNIDYLTDLKKERHELFISLLKNSRVYATAGILLIIPILVHFSSGETKFSNYILALALILEIISLFLILSIKSEERFYRSYYETYFSILRLLYSKQKEKRDSYLESFQINYNNLRKNTKKRIISSKRNFLTYDYEMNRIVHEIDTFFDATTKILFRNRIMNIPYFPEEEIERLVDKIIKQDQQSHIEDDIWDNYEPGDEEVSEYHEITAINFTSLKDFMIIYGNFIIRNPRKKVINTVAIAELFRKWNLVVEKLEPEIFKESKKDVSRYYNKKQEQKTYLYSKAYDFFIIFLISFASGLILIFLKA